MTTEYEYERVEIKPGDQSWVGKEIRFGHLDESVQCSNFYKVLFVGNRGIFLRSLESGWENCWGLDEIVFYIRKPKRKMVKKARALYIAPIQVFWGKANYGLEASSAPLTEEAAKLLYGHDLIKWPYGPTFEVEEGE